MKRVKAASTWDYGTHIRNSIDSMVLKLRQRRTGQRLSPDEIAGVDPFSEPK